ncbi:unnamed protein product [Linum trigynum]|uniref:Uncharacterized protein n=1 Tax=Linum trigynum TaxID=586398 RepID=A0AAV2G8L2_9ROSI
MPCQIVGEEVKTDHVIWYTIQLVPIGKLQEPRKGNPCLFFLEAMELDGGCDQLNPAWLGLKVICWDGRIKDDGADVGDPWSVVVLHSRTQRGWWMLSPIFLGNWVIC